MGLMLGLAALCLALGYVSAGFQPVLVSTFNSGAIAAAATADINKRAG